PPTASARLPPSPERLLGLMSAIPSGISSSQFTRWHLDHHAELGSDVDDPKRHHLSPTRNARWFKLLYCTPVLFPIYFRAARRESATYPPALQRQIAFERRGVLLGHLLVFSAPRGGPGVSGLLSRSGFLHFPDRVPAQSARPALRHRPDGSRQVGDADARPLVLGFR